LSRCSPHTDNRPCPPGAWHSSRSCNSPKGSPIGQAVNAVQSRIDWKYVLRLELTDPGFDASVLSEFRTRLITGAAEQSASQQILVANSETPMIAP
jgi:hypothetical protein